MYLPEDSNSDEDPHGSKDKKDDEEEKNQTEKIDPLA